MVRERNWGISNPFSENHRKCLPGNFCLWDIDGFFIDDKNEIVGIYEGKYKMESKDRGNFIKTFNIRSNIQAGFLKLLSDNMPIWICEESTQKWWSLDNRLLLESVNPNYHLIKTENRIYVEEELTGSYGRNNIGVFLRTEGEKPCVLERYIEINVFSGIKKILVNDIHEDNIIFFKTGDKTIKVSLNESDKTWNKAWTELGIIEDKIKFTI